MLGQLNYHNNSGITEIINNNEINEIYYKPKKHAWIVVHEDSNELTYNTSIKMYDYESIQHLIEKFSDKIDVYKYFSGWLYDCIKNNNNDTSPIKFIEENFNPNDKLHILNYQQHNFSPILCLTIIDKFDKITAELISQNVDINIRDKFGNTALSIAAYHENIYAIMLLLKSGVDINSKDRHENTFREFVTKYKNKHKMQIILSEYQGNTDGKLNKRSININHKRNPIIYYDDILNRWIMRIVKKINHIHKDNFQAIKPLINNYLDCFYYQKYFSMWLRSCLISDGDSTKSIEYIVDNFSQQQRHSIFNYRGRYNPILYTAIAMGLSEVIETLMVYGADINVKGFDGKSLLALSAGLGDIKTVKLLIDYGIKTDLPMHDRNSLINIIANSKCLHISTYLMQLSDKSTNKKNNSAYEYPSKSIFQIKTKSPILYFEYDEKQWRVEKNNEDFVFSKGDSKIEFIDKIKKGKFKIDKNSMTEWLKFAILNQHTDIIFYILTLNHNDNLSIYNHLDTNSFITIKINEMCEFRGSLFHLAVKHLDCSTIEKLIEYHKADVTLVHPYVGSILTCAINKNDISLINMILDDIKQKTEKDNIKFNKVINYNSQTHGTALICACKKGNYEVVKLLIDNGADITIRDSNNTTAAIITEKTLGNLPNNAESKLRQDLEKITGLLKSLEKEMQDANQNRY